MKVDQENKEQQSEEVSFRDIKYSIKSAGRYIKSKWKIILLASTLCGALGLSYAIVKKATYTAICTFVLEDPKGGGLSQYAGIASIVGLNIGGGGGGIFEGDNILELYQSRLMIEKALLSSAKFNGKNELLIDRYIDFNNLREQWKNNPQTSNLTFNTNADNFTRTQDSVITSLVDLFNLKMLNVSKPDKKLSIIKVELTSKDELFSKYFTEKLVETVNEFYIQTKTKKTSANVQILQHQADSVKSILNTSLNGVASAIDAAPNANPLMSTLRVTSQKRQVDVQANSAIYGEIVKNLELAKISLREEMPLIQVIDKPVLPLYKDKVTMLKGTLLGVIIGMVLTIVILVSKKLYQQL